MRDLILGLSLYYAFKTVGSLMRGMHQNRIMHIKKVVFLYLGLAASFLLAGFISQDFSLLIGKNQFGVISTALFFASNMLFIIAFSYFWHHSSKLHRLQAKEFLFFIGVIAAVFLWLHYLIINHIIPRVNILPISDKLLLLFNPISLALAFLLTLVIHPRYKAGVIRTPPWYLSSGVFMYFIGHMMMIYHHLRQESAILPFIYAFLMMMSSIYFLFGFFVASKKYRIRDA